MKAEELFGVDADCASAKCVKDATRLLDTLDRGCSLDDDLHDLYGVRTTTYGLPTSRPTMINPKYRQKEERRKVLKLSMNKLKSIEDPESSLRRSVLINNTVKRLQREAKEEKLQKNQIIAATASPTKCFGLSNDFIIRQEENVKTADMFAAAAVAAAAVAVSATLSSRTSDQLLDITNLPDSKTCSKYATDCLDCDEAMSELTFHCDRGVSKSSSLSSLALSLTSSSPLTTNSTCVSSTTRKRTIDDALEDEECDVLSQFYLPPPTPRMLPALDDDEEDEDVNVVDVDTPPSTPPAAKRKRGYDVPDAATTAFGACLSVTAADRLRDNLSMVHFDDWIVGENTLLPSSVHNSTNAAAFATSMSMSMSVCPSSTFALSSAAAAAAAAATTTTATSSMIATTTAGTINASGVSTCASASVPSPPFSCGHSSMLNEIVVYHNLIASLES